jgi:hypothetical protein
VLRHDGDADLPLRDAACKGENDCSLIESGRRHDPSPDAYCQIKCQLVTSLWIRLQKLAATGPVLISQPEKQD